MRTGAKKVLLIIIPIGCVIIATILTLSLITIRPLNKLGEYDNIRVLSGYGSVQSTNQDKDKVIKDSAETVTFSLMRSLLQGSARYNISPVNNTNKDGDSVRRKYTTTAFKNLSPKNGEFMIELSFDTYQTNDLFFDEDESPITFDRIILIIPQAKNTIQDIKVYPLLSFNMDNKLSDEEVDQDGHISSIYYNVYEFSGKMYTNKMHEMLSTEFSAGKNVAKNEE